MSIQKFNPRTGLILLITLVVALLRIIATAGKDYTDLANFSCIGAMAMFGAAYFNEPGKAFSVPLLTLLLSDLILSFTVYKDFRGSFLYAGWYWTYVAFAMMSFASRLILKKVTAGTVMLSVIVCTFIHWIVADIGMWLNFSYYPHTAAGYIACLEAALPFEIRFLLGTAAYSAVMFGLFEWLQAKNPELAGKRIAATAG